MKTLKNLTRKVVPYMISGALALGLGSCNKDFYNFQYKDQRGDNIKNGVYLDEGSDYLVVAEARDETGKRIPKSQRAYYLDWDRYLSVKKDGRVDMVNAHGENPLKEVRQPIFLFAPPIKIKRYSFQIDDQRGRGDIFTSYRVGKSPQEYWLLGRDRKETKILQRKFDELKQRYYGK